MWPEEKGVMVKRSDGDRIRPEKNRKWPREGLQKKQRKEREAAENSKKKNEAKE